MKNSNININVSPQGENREPWYSKLGKWYVDTIVDASLTKIIKVFFVTFFFLAMILSSIFLYNAFTNEEIVKATAEKVALTQKEENVRDFVVTPKIQHELEILTYTLNADRAFIFELHNGKKNTSGLPFRFADMTYEEINEERKVDKVAMKFQDIPLTLYKYPHYLQLKKMMIGTTEEISKIDDDYANHIREIGGKYLGMVYISNNGLPLGFLCVSYHDLADVPKKEIIESKLREYDKMFTQLLDLQVQMNVN